MDARFILNQNVVKAVRKVYKTTMIKKRNSLPILTHIRIIGSVDTQTLTMSSTNLDKGTILTLPAKINQDFKTCVPSLPFRDWLVIAEEYKSRIEVKYNKSREELIFVIEDMKSKTTFKCMPEYDFPNIEKVGNDEVEKIVL